MPYKYRVLILFFVALVSAWAVYNPILKIARGKNIVDNPDARKIQKNPVPVMGGIVVFFGMVVGLSFYKTMTNYTLLFPVLSAMVIMLYLGSMDDILSISPLKRFLIEIFVSILLLYGLRTRIYEFQGLWGIESISFVPGILLSILTFVGVVNAINMIDGVDGLSSGFSILITGSFGVFCFLTHQFSFASLSALTIGAIFPFFIHNVFGSKTKMFIGDGGTMMIGTLISAMVFVILGGNSAFPYNPEWDFSKIAFVLAVLSIPIADTLRVMACRILKGHSPFKPDMNHLHHILLKLDFSSSLITFVEVLMNIIVIFLFFLSWKLGASVDVQLYVVFASAALFDWVLSAFLNHCIKNNTKLFCALKKLGEYSHKENSKLRLRIMKLIDGE